MDDVAVQLSRVASAIRLSGEYDVETAIDRGRHVVQAQALLLQEGSGGFMAWCEVQRRRWRESGGQDGFRESDSTLANYRQAYQRFGDGHFVNFTKLSLSKLWELSAPSYPDDQVQMAIDRFIASDDLPMPMQEAVDRGEVGAAAATRVVKALASAPDGVNDLAMLHVIPSVGVVKALSQVAEKAPDLLEEFMTTGAVQHGDGGVTLRDACEADIRAAYKEFMKERGMEDWETSRDVLLTHYPIQFGPNCQVTLPGEVWDHYSKVQGKGKYFVTVTFVPDAVQEKAKEG